ncbi:MAG: methyltransferase domain-containing protein [Sphingobacteriales bacterium]|nr:methyltransferase domain-containing protein [Sphingobacteriales bacterium]
MPWSPDQYNQFKTERYAPFYDLLALIKPIVKPQQQQAQIMDLGCGTGELTHLLAQHLPDCHITGIDSSPEMLLRTNEYKTDKLHFELMPIEAFLSGNNTYDLIFSNAALQWVENHVDTLAKIIAKINKNGGQLIAQMPSNHNHITHLAIQHLASQMPYHKALNGFVRKAPVLKTEQYAQLLHDCGATQITIYEKIYPHTLNNATDLFNWAMGTALVPYFERLPDELVASFKSQYLNILEAYYPNNPVFYPFKRILLAVQF